MLGKESPNFADCGSGVLNILYWKTRDLPIYGSCLRLVRKRVLPTKSRCTHFQASVPPIWTRRCYTGILTREPTPKGLLGLISCPWLDWVYRASIFPRSIPRIPPSSRRVQLVFLAWDSLLIGVCVGRFSKAILPGVD